MQTFVYFSMSISFTWGKDVSFSYIIHLLLWFQVDSSQIYSSYSNSLLHSIILYLPHYDSNSTPLFFSSNIYLKLAPLPKDFISLSVVEILIQSLKFLSTFYFEAVMQVNASSVFHQMPCCVNFFYSRCGPYSLCTEIFGRVS